MANENDFYSQVGYDLPSDAPKDVTSEGIEYYKDPAGVYEGFLGRLTAKYKDVNDKKCTPETPGARFDHYQLTRWKQRFLGASPKEILGDDLHIGEDIKQLGELYFQEFISVMPKDQWSIHKKFASFIIPGHANLSIVQEGKASKKVTNFSAFPAYYGQRIKWEIVISDKGNPYIANTTLIPNERIPSETIILLEQKVAEIAERERALRESNRSSGDGGYTSSAPPSTSAEELLAGDSGDLDEYN